MRSKPGGKGLVRPRSLPIGVTAPSSAPRTPGVSFARCAACEIREFSFCAALEDEELGRLQAIVRQVRLAPRQMLFQEGDEADNVFNVLSGIIKL